MKNIYSLFIGILVFTSINVSVVAQTFSPTRGATGVTNSPIITITFASGSTVDYGSGNSIVVGKSWNSGEYIELKTGPRPSRDSRLTIVNDSIVKIDLSGSELDYSTEYFVSSMDHNVIVKDGTGWDNLYDDTYYRFTTESAPTPPSINKYIPNNNDTTVRLSDTLKIVFNEDVVLDRGYLKIKYCNDSSNFLAIEYNDSKLSITDSILSIAHTAFNQDSCYFVNIDSGFVQSVSTSTDFAGISEATTWKFRAIKVRDWIGNTSDSWSNSSNWGSNGLFVDGAIVNIPSSSTYNPKISSGSIEIADLIIEAGGGLSVSSGATLIVDSIIELKSSTSANAYLLCDGTLNYDPNDVKIHQNTASSSRWYYISSPVAGATKSSIGCTDDMYYWDNSTGLWETMDASTTMDRGKGYLLKSTNNLIFTGSIQTVNDTVDIDYGKSVGWNLIGNPYTNSINWDNVTLSSDSVFNGFWLYKNLDEIYGTYNGTTLESTNLINGSIIPPNHNFWVRLDTTVTESVIFTTACKSTTTGSYLKSSSSKTDFPLLKFAASNGSNRDEVIVSFADETITPLRKLNMTKKFSTNPEFIQPYFTLGTRSLCMKGIPNFTNQVTVPFAIKIDENISNTTGAYSIKALLIANFPDDIVILLNDLSTGSSTNLLEQKTYNFTEPRTGDITDRFELVFQSGISTAIQNKGNEQSSDIEVWSVNNSIKIELNNDYPADIDIFNISGQLINMYKEIRSNKTISNLNQGIYLIRVTQKGTIVTKKVFVK